MWSTRPWVEGGGVQFEYNCIILSQNLVDAYAGGARRERGKGREEMRVVMVGRKDREHQNL